MRIIISILWFLIFTKLFVFWLWLWQLKEYHWGRFKAHFETQKIRKFLFSFHGIRYPKLTPKVIAILISGIAFEILIVFYFYSLILFLILVSLAPLIVSLLVLLFQIPASIFIKRALKKAKQKREQFKDLIVIGITGSYGKSSTKEFLATILSQKYNVLKTKKNINAEIGIARTILKELNPKHQVFIAEIGAYNRGKIKEVCKMLQPRIGILTGINEQHLATFGSKENIIKAKYELIESLPKDGIAITKNKLDLRAEDIKVEKKYISFRVNSVDFKINLLGKHSVDNVLLAASCAKKLGMDLIEIARACQRIKPEQGGMKFLKKPACQRGEKNPIIIDSSYSANPAGVMADLEYLKIYPGKKIIVMPCLIELGKASKEIHQKIGRKISEICDLAIITTKDYFKEIKKEAPNALLIEKSEEILDKLKGFFGRDGVILLEGRVPKKICQSLNQFPYL